MKPFMKSNEYVTAFKQYISISKAVNDKLNAWDDVGYNTKIICIVCGKGDAL